MKKFIVVLIGVLFALNVHGQDTYKASWYSFNQRMSNGYWSGWTNYQACTEVYIMLSDNLIGVTNGYKDLFLLLETTADTSTFTTWKAIDKNDSYCTITLGITINGNRYLRIEYNDIKYQYLF